MRLTEQQAERWDEWLHNWAAWFQTRDRGGNVKVSGAYSFVAHGRPAEGDGVPAHVGNALDMQRRIQKLDRKHQVALEYRYVTTLSDGEAAREMRIDRTTFVHYVRHAKESLHILWLVEQSKHRRSTCNQ